VITGYDSSSPTGIALMSALAMTRKLSLIADENRVPRTISQGLNMKQERKSVFVLSFRHLSDWECGP
jgi:hypothetical protein